MDLGELVTGGFEFLKSSPVISFAIIFVIALLFYFKPKPMVKFFAILLAVGLLFYIVSLLGGATSTGLFQKDKMIHHSSE